MESFPKGRNSRLTKNKQTNAPAGLASLGMGPSPPLSHCCRLILLPLPRPQLPLGFPQLPTAPLLHPRGPRPGQVSGQPPGGAAARGAGRAVGAAAPGRRVHRGRFGLGAREDAPGGTVGLPCRRCSGQALYPFSGGDDGVEAALSGGGGALGLGPETGRMLGDLQ